MMGEQETFTARFVAIASGHHATPNVAKFPGQESFKGLSKTMDITVINTR